jgi:hypothetical protein
LAIVIAGLSLTAADSLLAVSFGLEARRAAALVAMAAIFLRLSVPPFHQVLSQLAESRAAVFVALAVTAGANLVVLCRFLIAMTNQLHFSGAALAKVALCAGCICAGVAVWQSSVRCRLLTIARAWGLALASAVCMQPSTPDALQMVAIHFAMIIAAVLGVGLLRTTALRRNPIAWFCTASLIGAPFTAGGATLCRIATTHSSVAPSLLWLLAATLAFVGIAAYRTLTTTAVAVDIDANLAPRFDSSPLGWLLQFHWASPALAGFVLFGGTLGIIDPSVKNPTPAASAQPDGTKVAEK